MIELPPKETLDVLADWAEMSCLFAPGRSFVSRSDVDRALDEAGLTDPETTAAEIWREIDRRHQITNKGHPVAVERHRLTRDSQWDQAAAYSFQLLISNHLNYRGTRISSAQWNSLAKLFEKLVAVAVSYYLGPSVVVMGTPRETPVPHGFREALNYLADSLQEVRGADLSISDDAKDDDLDVASWVSFRDARPGQVMLFVQCGAGDNWRDKTRDLSLELWQDYVDWAVAPLRGYAFPYVPIADTDWRRLCKEGGILLDRLRIASLYCICAGENGLRDRLITWCQEQLQLLPWEE